MKESYLTVKAEASSEIVVKKSRFIASVKPLSTEDDAIAFVNEIRQKYRDARHNVYAYIISENNITRYSDDKEPSKTAGFPILDSMQKEGLTDIAIVVTRYFGGILLGTGGLVHAYTAAAKAGIDAAQRTKMTLCRKITLGCDYSLWGKIQNIVSDFLCKSEPPVFSDAVSAAFVIPVFSVENFVKTITEETNASVDIKVGEECYFGFDI